MTTAFSVDQLKAGGSSEAIAAYYDSLPDVTIEEILGQWHGAEVPSGHPMDGLLDVSGWYGKRFDDAESVHPLLFGEPGDLFPVNPGRVPMGLLNRLGTRMPRFRPPGGAASFRPLTTRRHRARLRRVEFRGKVSTGMVYDQLPIIDHFRKIDDDTLLGAMDLRDSPRPYFFLLQRD